MAGDIAAPTRCRVMARGRGEGLSDATSTGSSEQARQTCANWRRYSCSHTEVTPPVPMKTGGRKEGAGGEHFQGTVPGPQGPPHDSQVAGGDVATSMYQALPASDLVLPTPSQHTRSQESHAPFPFWVDTGRQDREEKETANPALARALATAQPTPVGRLPGRLLSRVTRMTQFLLWQAALGEGNDRS